MIQELVTDARTRFDTGKPLVESVPKILRADISLFIRGGLAILDAIERIQCNVLELRPALSRWTKLRLLWGTVCGR
jgi:phytoene/squalene synthetase